MTKPPTRPRTNRFGSTGREPRREAPSNRFPAPRYLGVPSPTHSDLMRPVKKFRLEPATLVIPPNLGLSDGESSFRRLEKRAEEILEELQNQNVTNLNEIDKTLINCCERILMRRRAGTNRPWRDSELRSGRNARPKYWTEESSSGTEPETEVPSTRDPVNFYLESNESSKRTKYEWQCKCSCHTKHKWKND
eukprot:Gregarina_sp_Poly_1__5152@NODE_2729_length_1776_cov_35_214745_g1728_i0_p1_GENE_NODE_2729_length_1776_cov_35_214745_g1728_i0NODE_2729_length_1776_cov_35_214745_g1728_i0_p1_ORF_typecomplete_len192_score19_95_NODE_2729_length_1776_cov_35_214745_g1728_i06321207